MTITTDEACAFYSKHNGTERCPADEPACDRCWRVVQEANRIIAEGVPQWHVRSQLEGAMIMIVQKQRIGLNDVG